MERIIVLLVLLLRTSASNASHSLSLLSTYIEGKTQFPKFSYITALDDITVGYYNSERYIPKGNTSNEDDVVNSDYIKGISDYMHNSFVRRSALFRQHSQNDGIDVYQTMVVCELLDFDKPGKMLTKDAAGGCTTDELCYFNSNFTYIVTANITQEVLKPHLEEFKQKYEKFYYKICIDTLREYIKKRLNEVNQKKEPKVRFIQKANADSGRFRLSCLATGFYPRHINMSLFINGQPVADHEITGDLLPNGDGTYQMRKSLKISAVKHKYTCSVTHLSLDNKLVITWEDELSSYHTGVLLSGLAVLLCVCVILAIAIVICIKRQTESQTEDEVL